MLPSTKGSGIFLATEGGSQVLRCGPRDGLPRDLPALLLCLPGASCLYTWKPPLSVPELQVRGQCQPQPNFLCEMWGSPWGTGASFSQGFPRGDIQRKTKAAVR